MHIKDNLINFLYDKKYFINIYDNFVHVFNFKELVSLSSNLITLKFDGFNLEVTGSDLFITRLMPKEMLIKGHVANVGFKYE